MQTKVKLGMYCLILAFKQTQDKHNSNCNFFMISQINNGQGKTTHTKKEFKILALNSKVKNNN